MNRKVYVRMWFRLIWGTNVAFTSRTEEKDRIR